MFNDKHDGSVIADGILPAIYGVSLQTRVLISLSGLLFILKGSFFFYLPGA